MVKKDSVISDYNDKCGMKLTASEAETSSPSPEDLSTWEMASIDAKEYSTGSQGDGEEIRVIREGCREEVSSRSLKRSLLSKGS